MSRRSIASMKAEWMAATPERAAELEAMIQHRRENDNRRQREWRANNVGYNANPTRSARSLENKRQKRMADLRAQIYVYQSQVQDGVDVAGSQYRADRAKERLEELENNA